MNYLNYIGIDVSKEKLNIAITGITGEVAQESEISNKVTAIRKWLKPLLKENRGQDKLFCFEATGHYSYMLVTVLHEYGLNAWVANPQDIRQSIGMQRGKNDVVDARRIAEYARRFKDKARIVTDKEVELLKLKQLMSYREMLVTQKGKLKGQIKDYKGRLDKEAYKIIRESNQGLIKQLEKGIEKVEAQVKEIISSNAQTKLRYELIQSIPGIGKTLAAYLVSMTSDFTAFNNSRALACHAGVVPFHYSSGTKTGKGRVSHRSNKRLKSLLHLAAMTAIRCKGDMKNYYEKKVQEGKSKMLVLNSVRNKLITRVYAVIKRETPYQINLELT